MRYQTWFSTLLILSISSLAIFLVSGIAQAKPTMTFTVDDTNDLIDDNLADGICHTATGTCTLRAAVMQANSLGGANTINMPSGVYTLTLGELAIQSDLTINGTSADTTIVDGNQSSRVFDVYTPTLSTISKMTVRNGNATTGGGINNGGTLWISSTTILSNSAVAGGGIDNVGTLRITSSTIASNLAIGANANCGGINNTGYVETANTIISNNKALNSGGGICNNGIGDLQTLAILSNTAQYGAGIFNFNNGQLSVSSSTIWQNVAQVSGGGITSGGQLVLWDTTVVDNTAQFAGGGIDNGGLARLGNVTITGNSITNTLTGGLGGNLYNGYNITSSIQLANTIVAQSANGDNCASAMGIGITSLGHNLSDDNSCNLITTGDMTNTNPLLGSLQNNGGATPTRALLAGSPAINAGDNNGCPATDQRGISRPQAGICDIGAYEFIFSFSQYLPIIRR